MLLTPPILTQSRVLYSGFTTFFFYASAFALLHLIHPEESIKGQVPLLLQSVAFKQCQSFGYRYFTLSVRSNLLNKTKSKHHPLLFSHGFSFFSVKVDSLSFLCSFPWNGQFCVLTSYFLKQLCKSFPLHDGVDAWPSRVAEGTRYSMPASLFWFLFQRNSFAVVLCFCRPDTHLASFCMAVG